jgi:murein DD-endopeptidase MepM/ murein hydrolase activator NlpD
MLNISHILPNSFSFKRAFVYAKKALISNLALGLIALPSIQTNYIAQAQANLIIPEEQLDKSFNIDSEKGKTQIPLDFSYISQGFHTFHPGVDLVAKLNTPIKPVMKGVVEEAGFSPFGYGNSILIDHGDGIESLYAHLAKIEVKKGDEVSLHTEIGLVGTTGRSSGPHLHLEIHKNGVAINPLTFLPSLKNSGTRLLSSN